MLDVKNMLIPHYGLLDKEHTKAYLNAAEKSAVQTAEEIVSLLKAGRTKPEIVQFFKQKFYHGYVKVIYPLDAMELNASITVDMIEKELL